MSKIPVRKPASITVAVDKLEPGKEYEVREVTPPTVPPPPLNKDPIVGTVMSFARLSTEELNRFYDLRQIRTRSASERNELLELLGKSLDRSLGYHQDSPLDRSMSEQAATMAYYAAYHKDN